MAFNFGASSAAPGFGSSTSASFSSSTPAFGSSGGSLFGAPTPAVMAPPPAMHQYQQQQQQQEQQQQQPFSGNTPYSQLPNNAKRSIDQIYQLMMQHRRTMALVKTMAPALLTVENNDGAASASSRGIIITTTPRRHEITSADAAAGSPRPSSSRTATATTEFLPTQLISLQMQIQTLLQSAETNLAEATRLKAIAGETTAMAKMHGAWPIESIAARNGVVLSSIRDMLGDVVSSSSSNNNVSQSLVSTSSSDGNKPASSVNVSGGMTNVDAIALQQILDVRAARVDRIEPMPSPYFWEVLKNLEHRVSIVIRDVEAVRARLAMAEGVGLSGMGRDDTNMILANAVGGNDVMTSIIRHNGGAGSGGTTIPLSQKLVTLARSQSDHFLAIAAKAAHAHEGLEEVKLRYQRFCQATKGGFYDDPFLKADVEEFGREREMQHRILSEQMAMALPPVATPKPAPPPASTSGLFGQQPTSGGLFGAPAPSTGLFGASAPAPATGGGGLFDAPAPAPATGGLFGSSAPAPSAFGQPAPAPSLFGAAPGGVLFGAPAPSAFGAPASASSNLFGSAPAPAFGVAPTTPASTLAPRKKTSASRSGGRRR